LLGVDSKVVSAEKHLGDNFLCDLIALQGDYSKVVGVEKHLGDNFHAT